MQLFIPVAIIFASFQSLDCLNDNATSNSRLNFFDIDLLRYSAEDKRGNVMVSPASIKSTLAMLLEGANGDTAVEIKSALRLSPVKEDLREQLHLYLKALQANSTGVLLQNANAVFVSKKLKVRQEYEMLLKHVYLSEIVKLDFDDPRKAAQNVNNWVNEKTKGLIPSIVEPDHVDPLSEMLVTNALYFKSSWQHAFNPRLTHGACFYRYGACKTVAMMDVQAELKYAYVDNLRSHALELPYQDKRYSMILLVPQDRDGCTGLIRDLPYMSLPQISSLMEPADVRLTMPKFTVDYSEDIVAALQSLRITSLFTSNANLSSIFEGTTPYVSNIFHRVYMSVDEIGTVAAAATSAVVVPLINDGVELRVDRPFVFFIRDNSLGLVLFEGKIEEPTEFVEKNSQEKLDHGIQKPTRKFWWY